MSVKPPSHEIVHELPAVLVKEDLHDEGSVDPVYQAKARILNHALQEIGMGKYQVRTHPYRLSVETTSVSIQWSLFVVAGFGWFA